MNNTKDFSVVTKQKENQIEFTLNTRIYTLPVIYQAAYFLLDKVYVFLDGDVKTKIKVIMKGKENSENLEKITGEFYNELLNQLLRGKVSETNAKIREYIVSQALYNAVPNEVDELLKEVEEEDWQEDPLGISKPWEESQAQSPKKKVITKGKAPSLKLRSPKKGGRK